MAESLHRVSPVPPDALDGRIWEGQNQGRNPKKGRGDRSRPDMDLEPDAKDNGDPAPSSGLVDVRI